MSQQIKTKESLELPDVPPGEKTPFCIIAKYNFKPERTAEMEKRMTAMAKHTRTEPGCLAFHIHRDRSDENLYVIYEMWQDIEAVKLHFKQDDVNEWVADMPGFLAKDLEIEWLIMMEE